MVNAWAQDSDVASITGITVDDGTILAAQSIVENVCHRLFGIGKFRARDTEWLRKAVAYQAAWMSFQPDLFFRVQASNVSGDGQSATSRTKADVYLAPLAGKAIKNLSWMKSRSLRAQTPFMDGARAYAPLDPALADDSNLDWGPM